jgi:hypothetical protein
MTKLAIAAFTLVSSIAFLSASSVARPVYARNESKPCGYCHVRPQGGGSRGFRGQFYGANGLSFEQFKEEREAIIAGLTSGAEGVDSVPALSYVGNVAGPAVQQIQLASLRGPVAILFIGKADADTKLAIKTFAALSKSIGMKSTFLAVTRSNDAVKLTEDLGSLIRVLPDPDGAAAKKFEVMQELDSAVAAKLGDPLKVFQGFSRKSVEDMAKALNTNPVTVLDAKQWSVIPEKPLRGYKL